MIRRLPVIPTLVVLAAVFALISLGVWQLRRANEKEALLARYASAQHLSEIGFPTIPLDDPALPFFRKAKGNCLRVVDIRTSAGSNRDGETGFVFIADCTTGAEGPGMSVQLGWSKNPQAKPNWRGGIVRGIIVPDRKTRIRLLPDTGLGGLEPSALPSIETVTAVTPSGHRGYALIWFSFAAMALIIYGLALRKKLQAEGTAE